MKRKWSELKPMLEELLEQNEAVREERLAALRAHDPELHEQLVPFLAADESLVLPIDQPALGPTRAEANAHEEVSQIGTFRVQRQIGRGGMGVVYLAVREQDDCKLPLAIKVLHRGMDSDEIVARFLREREILAQLKHPNIVTLLEGGCTSDNRPYLVMDFVDGEAITSYCDQMGLELAARIRLFCKVCAAVQFAHRNLVVHRDLKPSNILVNAAGEPKLLDFGIAKILDHSTDATLTRGYTPLTPSYASPEQLTNERITTAADIYSLGVILCELLCGSRPFEGKELHVSFQRQAQTLPPKPSSLLLRMMTKEKGDLGSEIAHRRKSDPKHLRALLSGDLDAIVQKALRWEPEQRYESAAAFAEDLQRYLEGFPVLARRGSFSYRTGKFIRRNRLSLIGSTALLLILGVTAHFTWRQFSNACIQTMRSDELSSLTNILLESQDPYKNPGVPLDEKSESILETLFQQLSQNQIKNDKESYRLTISLARVYFRRGNLERASQLYTSALEKARAIFGSKSVETAEVLYSMGRLSFGQGNRADAFNLFKQALSLQIQLLGSEANPTLETRLALANCYFVNNQIDLFEQESIAILTLLERQKDPDRELYCTALCFNGWVSIQRNQFEAALQKAKQAIAIQEKKLGENNVSVTRYYKLAAQAAVGMNQIEMALVYLEKEYQIQLDILGSCHPQVLLTRAHLWDFYNGKNLLWKAQQMAKTTNLCGDTSFEKVKVIQTLLNLSDVLTFLKLGDFENSESLLNKIAVTLKETPADAERLISEKLLAIYQCYCLAAQGKHSDDPASLAVLGQFQESLSIYRLCEDNWVGQAEVLIAIQAGKFQHAERLLDQLEPPELTLKNLFLVINLAFNRLKLFELRGQKEKSAAVIATLLQKVRSFKLDSQYLETLCLLRAATHWENIDLPEEAQKCVAAAREIAAQHEEWREFIPDSLRNHYYGL